MSRYGWIRRSLMNCQMIRVISSPSSSTTGPTTLIFAMRARLLDVERLRGRARPGRGRIQATHSDRWHARSVCPTGAARCAPAGRTRCGAAVRRGPRPSSHPDERMIMSQDKPEPDEAPDAPTGATDSQQGTPAAAPAAGSPVTPTPSAPPAGAAVPAPGPASAPAPNAGAPAAIPVGYGAASGYGTASAVVADEDEIEIEAVRATLTGPSLVARLGAELFGTFVVVLAGVGAALFASVSGAGAVGIALGFGFGTIAAFVAVSHVSGGHFNPAITLGSTLAGRTPWAHLVPYWLAQLVGGALASAVLFVTATSLPALEGNERTFFSGTANGYGA